MNTTLSGRGATLSRVKLPDQKVSTKKKAELQFSKDTIDFYIDEAISTNTDDILKIKQCFNILNGDMEEFDLEYILNPYKFEDGKARQMPARLKNFSIILPIFNLFLGEFISSQLPYTVYSTNSDIKIKFLDDLKDATTRYLVQEFTNVMNENGFDMEAESKEQPPFEEFLEQYENEWIDERTIIGQEAIDYLTEALKLQNNYLRAFSHWLIADRFYTYKRVEYDTVVHEIVHPLEGYPIKNKSEYVEDYDGFVRMDRISYQQLIDRYRDEMSKSDVENIYRKISDVSYESSLTTPFLKTTDVTYNDLRSEENQNEGLHNYHVRRYHVVFKSQTKVGILTYMNMMGQIKQCDVSEDYKLDKEKGDIDIEWVWINQVFEGYRFGDGDDSVYVTLRPILEQRDDLNNKSICKLPYGGKIGAIQDLKFTNLVNIGIEYQLRYNVWHRKLEMTINKHKDKIIAFPKGMIPDDDDMGGMDDFMYFANADGLMLYDETKPNASFAVQGIKVLDMNLFDYIGKLYEVIQLIKQEFWDSVGMNANRYGQIKASQGKGANEAAIERSSIISINMFDSFYAAIENDLQGLLDVSKFAWLDKDDTKSIGAYVASDNRVKHFNINGRKHLESNYGVFVGRYGKIMDKLNKMKELAFSMSQNGNHEVAMIAINSDNPVKLEKAVKAAMEAERTYQQQMQQQEQQAAMQIEQMQAQREQLKNEIEMHKIDTESKTKLAIAGLNADVSLENAKNRILEMNAQSGQLNEEQKRMDDLGMFQDKLGVEKAKHNQEAAFKLSELAMKHRMKQDELETQRELKNKELAVKMQDIETKLKIAKENKNKYDVSPYKNKSKK